MGAAASSRRLPPAARRVQQLKPSTTYSASSPPSPPSSNARASATKSDDILKDAQDPHFSTMLRSLGSVAHDNTPPPYPSPSSPPPPQSSTLRPPLFALPPRSPHAPAIGSSQKHPGGFVPRVPDSVRILQARETLNEHMGVHPEEYLDIFRVREVVMMRQEGGSRMRDEEIERRLRLKKGVLARLGRRVGHTGVQVREEKSQTVATKVDKAVEVERDHFVSHDRGLEFAKQG
ncbi:hypothetical protein Dda_3767 [Drechslerella dactyloides]|uniref:Helix-turn-helix domain-containing protein n=1 Tax=Drechslerella dactyloides TaxID=74499 RepID=A0AAD6J304_DREDA|nr:hypothetical protein Dda_3767 [Drechslerella dactyloides]